MDLNYLLDKIEQLQANITSANEKINNIYGSNGNMKEVLKLNDNSINIIESLKIEIQKLVEWNSLENPKMNQLIRSGTEFKITYFRYLKEFIPSAYGVLYERLILYILVKNLNNNLINTSNIPIYSDKRFDLHDTPTSLINNNSLLTYQYKMNFPSIDCCEVSLRGISGIQITILEQHMYITNKLYILDTATQ